MNIEWNKVTWYSWLVAIIVFVGAFCIGIWLGIQIGQERMMKESSMASTSVMQGMNEMKNAVSSSTAKVIAKVNYSCDAGKKLTVVYTDGHVQVTANDGTSLTLPQTMSADGGRYANSDESFIFWSKGNGAFVLQTVSGVSTTTYSNCTQI